MKTTVNRKEFADASAWVAGAVPTRPLVPVLAGILLTTTDDGLRLSATDYERWLTVEVDAQVHEPGDALVSGLLLRDLVGKLRGTETDLTLDEAQLHLAAARSNYRLRTMPVVDHPRWPEDPPAVGTVGAGALQAAFAAVRYANGDNVDGVDGVHGTYLAASDRRLTLATTDRYRFAQATTGWTGADFTARVPTEALTAALRGLAGTVEVVADDTRVGFRAGVRHSVLTCLTPECAMTLFESKRPTPDVTLTVDVDDLVDAVGRAGVVVTERNQPVRLAVADQTLSVTAVDGEVGDGDEHVDCDTDGETASAVNPGYLVDVLKALGSDRASIGFAQAMRPITLTPAVPSPSSRHLLMPVRPQGGF